jgi:hypothetical protein
MLLGHCLVFAAVFAVPLLADDVIVTPPAPAGPTQPLREATPLAPATLEGLNAARREQEQVNPNARQGVAKPGSKLLERPPDEAAPQSR